MAVDGISVLLVGVCVLGVAVRWMARVAGADVAHAVIVDLVDADTGTTPQEGAIVRGIMEVYEYDYNGTHYCVKSDKCSSDWRGLGENVDIYVNRKKPNKLVHEPNPMSVGLFVALGCIWIAVGLGVLLA